MLVGKVVVFEGVFFRMYGVVDISKVDVLFENSVWIIIVDIIMMN